MTRTDTLWLGKPWPRYLLRSVCGHVSETAVSKAYPVTTWCETCGHYVSAYFEERSAQGAGDE